MNDRIEDFILKKDGQMSAREMQVFSPRRAKIFIQGLNGTFIELAGIVTNLTGIIRNCIGAFDSMTIEMDVTNKRLLQAHEVPPEDHYEEWKQMVLKGLQ